MSTSTLLYTLEQQVNQLADAVNQTHAHPSTIACFDSSLFHCRGTQLRDYLAEIKSHLAKIHTAVNHQNQQQVVFLTERLLAQIEALQRELATASLRHQEPKEKIEDLDIYQRLAQNQGYEQRLVAMIYDHEKALSQQNQPALQAKSQKEIATLEMRLARCRKALQQIERKIERQERRNQLYQ